MLVASEYYNFTQDVIGKWAVERPDGLALWCVDADGNNESKLTFRQLACRAEQAAGFFKNSGIEPGDRVLLILPRVQQWWIAVLGLIRLGAVPVPCPIQLTANELHYRSITAGVKATIIDAAHCNKMGEFAGIRIVVGDAPDGCLDFDKGVNSASSNFSAPKTRSDAAGILYFTSATTGHPKMVFHTQASYGLAHRMTGEYWLDLKPGDVHWNISDLGWAKAAWSSLFGPWHMGACVFAADNRGKFLPRVALNFLNQFPIHSWCVPPTALRLIIKENLSGYHFPNLRHCVSAGEPLNPEIIAVWKSVTGLTIHEAYGQTETVMLIGNNKGLGCEVRPGSMGKANPQFDIAIVDNDLNVLPPDQEGEVAVRVKPVRPLGLFREYWKNPEQNAAQFRGDWYLTGDQARRDADGYFWFVGRKDDVIKSSGYRIGPGEVESVLLEHPAVLDVGVVGKADDMRGQVVKAFIVLREGFGGTEILKHEIQRHCKEKAAPYKYPREIDFVTELPKTTSGKIKRYELRAMS